MCVRAEKTAARDGLSSRSASFAWKETGSEDRALGMAFPTPAQCTCMKNRPQKPEKVPRESGTGTPRSEGLTEEVWVKCLMKTVAGREKGR